MTANTELLFTLLAGWASGAAAGLATTALVLIVAARSPALASRIPLGRHPVLLGIVAANATVWLLTLVGLLMGVAYYHAEDTRTFVLGVGAGAAAIAGLYVFVRRGWRGGEAPLVLGALAIAVLAYAVMLPQLMALRG